MAITYLTPDEIADNYLTYLKGLKPEINTNQQDSDWWVRSRVNGGLLAGVYSDQRLVNLDTFPNSARHEALGYMLDTYLNDTFIGATPAVGMALVIGVSGSSVSAGLDFTYLPNGNVYQATTGVDFGAATSVLVPIQSVNTGQTQNLISGAPLEISSPPAGVNPNASASGNISDGRNDETDPEAASRIIDFIQSPPAGGNTADYKRWAQQSDPSVTTASVLRFAFGFGTVGVVITAGTTDIDSALDNNQPIIRIPSDDLIEKVEAYIEALSPVTDCVSVLAPVELPINVTVKARFAQGDSTTIIAGQTLSQGDLVKREVQRALYKLSSGGRQVGSPASGFVLASEIEEAIDVALGDTSYITGGIPILVDRQVEDLAATGPNLFILNTQLPTPGTISVVGF